LIFGKYPVNQFDEVWGNYKYLIKELVISYLNGMDFDKMIEFVGEVLGAGDME